LLRLAGPGQSARRVTVDSELSVRARAQWRPGGPGPTRRRAARRDPAPPGVAVRPGPGARAEPRRPRRPRPPPGVTVTVAGPGGSFMTEMMTLNDRHGRNEPRTQGLASQSDSEAARRPGPGRHARPAPGRRPRPAREPGRRPRPSRWMAGPWPGGWQLRRVGGRDSDAGSHCWPSNCPVTVLAEAPVRSGPPGGNRGDHLPQGGHGSIRSVNFQSFQIIYVHRRARMEQTKREDLISGRVHKRTRRKLELLVHVYNTRNLENSFGLIDCVKARFEKGSRRFSARTATGVLARRSWRLVLVWMLPLIHLSSRRSLPLPRNMPSTPTHKQAA